MSKLEDFLGLDDISEVKKTIKVKAINGAELEMVVRPLTNEEHSLFQKRSQIINKKSISFDSAKYSQLVLSECIIEPNFKDENFLKKAKCNSDIDFLTRKFPAGTLLDISGEIQKLSGFESIDLEIEEAKN